MNSQHQKSNAWHKIKVPMAFTSGEIKIFRNRKNAAFWG
jgi:hypothetical protein